jgi:hypothetical protein
MICDHLKSGSRVPQINSCSIYNLCAMRNRLSMTPIAPFGMGDLIHGSSFGVKRGVALYGENPSRGYFHLGSWD